MTDTKSITIDKKIIDRLLKKIILLEKKNLKTKQYSYAQIVKKLQAMIEEEVECY